MQRKSCRRQRKRRIYRLWRKANRLLLTHVGSENHANIFAFILADVFDVLHDEVQAFGVALQANGVGEFGRLAKKFTHKNRIGQFAVKRFLQVGERERFEFLALDFALQATEPQV